MGLFRQLVESGGPSYADLEVATLEAIQKLRPAKGVAWLRNIDKYKSLPLNEFIVRHVQATCTRYLKNLTELDILSEGWFLLETRYGWVYGPLKNLQRGEAVNWVPTLEKAADMIRRTPLCRMYQRATDDLMHINR